MMPSYSILVDFSLWLPPSELCVVFMIPSIFNVADRHLIVLFDRRCNLCNCNPGVQLVLDLDGASFELWGNLHVAALQLNMERVMIRHLTGE